MSNNYGLWKSIPSGRFDFVEKRERRNLSVHENDDAHNHVVPSTGFYILQFPDYKSTFIISAKSRFKKVSFAGYRRCGL